jgi:thiaminase
VTHLIPLARPLLGRAQKLLKEISQQEFNQLLFSGNLAPDVFHKFLVNDKIYLKRHAHAITRLAKRANSQAEQNVLEAIAANISSYEVNMLDTYLNTSFFKPEPRHPMPVINTYSYHLHYAVTHRSFGCGLASCTPCFWLYASLAQDNLEPQNPYFDWLTCYGELSFQNDTNTMVTLFNKTLLQTENTAEQNAMTECFFKSLNYEKRFFNDVMPKTSILTCNTKRFNLGYNYGLSNHPSKPF